MLMHMDTSTFIWRPSFINLVLTNNPLPSSSPTGPTAQNQFPSFVEAVDEFYSAVEGQKHTRQAASAQASARGKVEKFKQDQERARRELSAAELRTDTAATLVLLHADSVDKLLLVINSNLDAGMGWSDLEHMVRGPHRRTCPSKSDLPIDITNSNSLQRLSLISGM
jgi:hypothetical protein